MHYLIPAQISVTFPFSTSRLIEDEGVLTNHVERLYSRDQMDELICQLIKRHPYVEGALYIDIHIFWQDDDGNQGFYHRLRFLNDNYTSQLPGNPAIQFEK